ncbi:MAG: hypothetical protein ACYTX0_13525 [Nostoc sp.]
MSPPVPYLGRAFLPTLLEVVEYLFIWKFLYGIGVKEATVRAFPLFFINSQCPILLYERLRQRLLYETLRERYFDPSLRDATRSLLPRSGTAKLRATRPSVPFGKLRAGKVSTSAQCPLLP